MGKFKSAIIKGLIDFIDTWFSKHGTDKSVLTEWKGCVFHRVDEKINTLS